MKIKSGDTFAALMAQEQFSNAELGRAAGCSKSFISQLRRGKKTCTPALARRIAEALTVPTGTLFAPSTSSEARQIVLSGTAS